MLRILAAVAVVLAVPALQAQDAWPTKPITMIAPFPPGGVADIVGRPLAASMEKTLKQPVLVVNRPGAGGAVGHHVGREGGARRLHHPDVAVVDLDLPGVRPDERHGRCRTSCRTSRRSRW